MMSLGLTLEGREAAHAAAGLIGPNAVLQLDAAMRAAAPDHALSVQVFKGAGLLHLYHKPPEAMIDEAIPARLFASLWRELPEDQARHLAHEAGRRTGAYVLANRIPGFAKLILRLLPARLSAALLLKAIRRNAWTFAGSGHCEVAWGDPAIITIINNPLILPEGIWHVGVFEELFRSLVAKGTVVQHVDSREKGASVSRFEIDWHHA